MAEKNQQVDSTAGRPAKRGRWKRNLALAIALALALTGAGLILYPTADNFIYEQQVERHEQAFIQKKEDNAQPYEDLYQYLKQENQRMFETGQSGLKDAFSYQTAGIDLTSYGITDGCIGFVEIPSINVKLPIYLGANTANMDKGAVHLTETSYPIGGINTNAVIAAHRAITKNMFKNINKIRIGDKVLITNFREQLVYQVVRIEIIQPYEINKVKIQAGRDMVTLFSCDPPGQTTYRYVVYCERAG